MNNRSFRISIIFAAILVLCSYGTGWSDNISVGDNIKIFTTGNGNAQGGGEFRLKDLTSGDQFVTFCLERDEFFSPGTGYTVTSISTTAQDGGTNTDMGDQLDVRTAYLYYNYRMGSLNSLFSGFSYGNDADVNSVQAAIWYFEGEQGPVSCLDWDLFSQFMHIPTDIWSELGPVVVVSFGQGRQDLLAMKPVPEPATMLLFGTGLLGLAGYGRKKFKKK